MQLLIQSRVCTKCGPSTDGGGPIPQGIGPRDMISELRMTALHIEVSCLFHQTYGNSVWNQCIGVFQ